jgi:hypothetical protein
MDEAASHGVPRTLPQALGRLRVALEDAFERTSRELGLKAQQAELLCAAMRPAAVGDPAQTLRCDRSWVEGESGAGQARFALPWRPAPPARR